MNVLLDTHSLIWWLDDDPGLNDAARATIADPQNRVCASVASLWEVGIKHALGKIPVHPSVLWAGVEQGGIELLNVSPDHTVRIADLPLFEDHRDPFDRMLVAQAIVSDLVLVTADSKIQQHRTAYSVEILWAGL